MPAPIPYNGGQSRLEWYALNGQDPSQASLVGLGLGRPSLINQTTLKYGDSFKNPVLIGGDESHRYGVGHTNAIADATSPQRGKGTGDGVSNGEYSATLNYAGGDTFDINGQDPTQGSIVGLGLGRNASVSLNIGTWGYGYSSGNQYYHDIFPDTSLNRGNVII
jgi:hypothetical protein